jgi:hypothetical protein
MRKSSRRSSKHVKRRAGAPIRGSGKEQVLRCGKIGLTVSLSDEAASLETLGTVLAMLPPRFVAVARPTEMASHSSLNEITAILYLPHNHRDPVLPNQFSGRKVYDPETGQHLPVPAELGGGIVIYDPETGFALPVPEPDAPDSGREELREP